MELRSYDVVACCIHEPLGGAQYLLFDPTWQEAYNVTCARMRVPESQFSIDEQFSVMRDER